jgi:quinol monooxygenase YgiN
MTLKGWRSTTLVTSADGHRIVIYSQWDSQADIEAMRNDARMMAYFPQIGELAAFDSMIGTVALSHQR